MRANVLKVGGDATLPIRAINAAMDATDAVALLMGQRRLRWDWLAVP